MESAFASRVAASAAASCAKLVDHGPFPCVEEGCPSSSVSCAYLAGRHYCENEFGVHFEKPPEGTMSRKISELCTWSCGGCAPARQRHFAPPPAPAQLESEPAPAFVVYLCGHLRTFPLLAKRQLEQWDEFAAGAPYLVYLHTFDSLDHSRRVWYRTADTARGAAGEERYSRRVLNERFNVSEIIAASPLPIAASEVSAHARVVTTPRRLNVSDERCIHGLTCVGDVSIQLQSLSRVHRLAGRHLRGELRLTEAQLDDLIVIRSRPDVTWNTDVADGASAAKAERRSGQTFQDLERRFHTKTQRAEAPRNGGVVVGYRGPWMGGWGDIVWAARYRDVSTLVGARERIAAIVDQPPPAVDSLPPFNKKVTEALRSAHADHRYRAELVWMHYVRSLGLRPTYFRFCNVCRYRLGLAPPANMTISKVHLHSCA